MKTKFTDILIDVLEREDAFVNPICNSGANRFNVPASTLKRHGIDVVRDVSLEEAKDLYRSHVWDLLELDHMPAHLRKPLFEMAINRNN